MFCGDTIIFDGVSSEEFGLMLVGKLDNNEQGGGLLGSKVSIIEDTLLRRPSPIYYASEQNEPLEFNLILSVSDETSELSRHDLAAIASWLYGHHEYKELAIYQSDLSDYFYRCKITELEPLFVAGRTVGLNVSVRCDAPYAYMRTANDIITCSESLTYVYHNRSNMNTYFKPNITIVVPSGSTDVEILNTTTGDSACTFSSLPSTGVTINVDCQRQILASDEISNVYEYCNFNFPAFIKGANTLQLTGNFTMTIVNEFPMYIGA